MDVVGEDTGEIERQMLQTVPVRAAVAVPLPASMPASVAAQVPAEAEAGIKPASGREHRRDERYPVEGHAEVIVVGEPRGTSLLRGRILDISVSGCFIQTIARLRLRPETKVEIFFSVKGKVIRAIGASRFSKSKVGIGFRFLAMSEEMQEKLDELIDDARSAWMALSAESRAREHGLADVSAGIGDVQAGMGRAEGEKGRVSGGGNGGDASAGASAGASVGASSCASVGASVRTTVWNPLGVNGPVE
jgi:PilZ domain